MKKITYIVLHLGFGGVERAIISQANMLCDFYEVKIISAYKLYDKPAFWLDSRVSVDYLMDIKPNKSEFKQAIKSKKIIKIMWEAVHALRVLFNRTNLMKKAIRQTKSDIIISSRYLYNRIVVKNAAKDIIIIAQEHRHHGDDYKYIKRLIKSVKGMDFFMPVSKELTDFYSEELRKKGVRCVYIPHSIDYWPEKRANLNEKRFISVGRLSKEKGFLSLIETIHPILIKYPDWSLDIIGSGDEKEKIEEKINQFHLNKQIILHGFKDKDYINEMLRESSIYLMSSFEESFGIVLIEAQSFGLPCVAFDSAQGAKEIIDDNKNGYLVPNRDQEKFIAAVERIMIDFDLRLSLGQEARRNAAKYKEDIVKKEWKNFIDTILKGI